MKNGWLWARTMFRDVETKLGQLLLIVNIIMVIGLKLYIIILFWFSWKCSLGGRWLDDEEEDASCCSWWSFSSCCCYYSQEQYYWCRCFLFSSFNKKLCLLSLPAPGGLAALLVDYLSLERIQFGASAGDLVFLDCDILVDGEDISVKDIFVENDGSVEDISTVNLFPSSRMW